MRTTFTQPLRLIAIALLLALVVAVAPVQAAPADSPRARALDEITRYLAAMDDADLASALKLFRIRELIKTAYVDDPAAVDLLAGSAKGAVAALGDPYSEYLDAKAYHEFSISTRGSFGGVGMVLGVKDKKITVIAPIEGTPAEAAGIISGDHVIRIDGRETKDMTLEEAVALIRGREGSIVTLNIGRAGREPQDYTIVRDTIKIKTVSGRMLGDGVGYLRVAMFNETTGNDFAAKFRELEDQGMKAVVLDLRGNPGGLLEECVKVAGRLIPAGPVVSIVNRYGERKTSYASGGAPGYPLVVLIDGGSASAAEIVAGAVRDTGAGTLVGAPTFGKGSVQGIVPLGDGTAVKLTTSRYYTPMDKPITEAGIEPDIAVEVKDEDREAARDVQLNKALEVIKAKPAGGR